MMDDKLRILEAMKLAGTNHEFGGYARPKLYISVICKSSPIL